MGYRHIRSSSAEFSYPSYEMAQACLDGDLDAIRHFTNLDIQNSKSNTILTTDPTMYTFLDYRQAIDTSISGKKPEETFALLLLNPFYKKFIKKLDMIRLERVVFIDNAIKRAKLDAAAAEGESSDGTPLEPITKG